MADDDVDFVYSDDCIRILLEVTIGKAPAKPDTPRMAELRRKVEISVADAKAKGMIIEIPWEWP